MLSWVILFKTNENKQAAYENKQEMVHNIKYAVIGEFCSHYTNL